MITTKILLVTVNLSLHESIYSTNKVEIITNILNKKYKNKCFQSILITEIIRIIQYSDTLLEDDRLDGSADIDVQFEVKGIHFITGELLVGCKVVDINAKNMLIESKYADGSIQIDSKKQINTIISKGQFIPVVIISSRYNPNKNKITITASPYYPQITKNIIYSIAEIPTMDQIANVEKYMNKLNEEIDLHKEIMKDSKEKYKFFSNIVYPFKSIQKFESTKLGNKFKKIESKDFNSLYEKDKYHLISPIDNYNEIDMPLLYSDSSSLVSEEMILFTTLDVAIQDFVSKRLLYMQSIRNLCMYYESPEQIDKMMTYWKMCNKLKN
jgi:DNA-directed RNA polymerase subunit E'/Rpb7